MRIYLDSCCYNRPFDDLSQEKLLLEAEAVKKIVNMAKMRKILLVSSQFVKYEIDEIKLEEKRNNVRSFYYCDEYYILNDNIEKLAKYYQTFNLKTFDSLHLAVAELNNVDYLLTTDIDFISFSTRFSHNVKVINPCDFFKEEFQNAT